MSEPPVLESEEPLPEPPSQPQRALTEPQEPIELHHLSPSAPQVDIDGETQPAVPLEHKWRVRPHVVINGVYDDNIFIQPDHKETDFIVSAAVGASVGYGDFSERLENLRKVGHRPESFWELQRGEAGNFAFIDYTATPVFFLSHSDENSIDQDALASFEWIFNKLTLGLEARYQSLFTSDIDIGGRVRQNLYDIAADVRYSYTDKTSFELRLAYNIADYQTGIDTNELTEENWLNYQILPKIQLSAGAIFGRLGVQNSDEQIYQQALLRAVYNATGKISINANAGVEFREFGSSAGEKTSPIVAIGASYAPFDGTAISLDIYHRVQSSASLVDEDIALTGISATVRQRFFQRLYFTLEGGYQHARYETISSNSDAALLAPSRTDDYFYLRPALASDLTRWATAEFFYLYRKNNSTVSSTSFANNQVGLSLNVLF